jgi:hypothetical protein
MTPLIQKDNDIVFHLKPTGSITISPSGSVKIDGINTEDEAAIRFWEIIGFYGNALYTEYKTLQKDNEKLQNEIKVYKDLYKHLFQDNHRG